MRKGTFIGLIMLVAMLVVAASPPLLAASASGIEQLAIMGNLIADEPAERAATRSDQSEPPVAGELLLRGHVLEEDGDLRDQHLTAEREANQSGRLVAGAGRLSLPGQQPDQGVTGRPPETSNASFVRDASGCPTFGRWDPVAMWENDELRQQWLDAAGDADDPDACVQLLDAQVEAAAAPAGALPGDRNRVAASLRSDTERLMIQLRINETYARVFPDWVDAQDLAELQRARLAAPTRP
jgi:hypothetical protein